MMNSFDYSPEAQLQHANLLRESIDAALTGSEDNFYLLVDPISLPKDVHHPFISSLLEQRPVPIRLPHEKMGADVYPWLIALDINNAEHAALLDKSIAFVFDEIHPEHLSQGNGRAVSGWLISPHDADTLARQLGETAIQRRHDHSQILLRYYDPAVHSVLWAHFSELQQQRLMGVIRNWIYVDGDGNSVIHHINPPVHSHYTFSLALSADDAVTVALCGKINRTLEQYRLHGQTSPRHPEIHAVRTIRDAIERAISLHKFEQESDQQALALDCLHWHGQFDMHPQMRLLLSPQEREVHASYSRCTQLLTDTARKKICDELSATTVTPPTY
ncbi:TPA: DUF4123 domain-containing protein [Serratia fonticola]|nr:DUF4123 domain-containing protein [Serratia fonticola]